MSGMRIPWSEIYDFLAELGSAGSLDEFARLLLRNIGRLVPFDNNGLFVAIDASGTLEPQWSIIECTEWFRLFNERYRRFMPDVRGEPVVTEDYDWGRGKSRFVNEFLRPQGIRHSIGVFHAGNFPERAGSFALFRSKRSRPFTKTEETICRIIQPHFGNLCSLLAKLNPPDHQAYRPAPLAMDCKLLSKREAEVAALLCLRLTRPEIATRLMLSPRTVEFHIRNIYEKLAVRSRRELLAKAKEFS